jgi:uncharacterized membrane protein YdbT with pleckstrin-like domain
MAGGPRIWHRGYSPHRYGRLIMGRYIDTVLLKDERVIFGTCLHWIVYVHGLVTTIIGGLVAHFGDAVLRIMFGDSGAEQFGRPVSVIAAVIVGMGCLFLLMAYITQISTELAVTNRRVIAKTGFISRTTFELFLNKVEGANIDQTIMGRLLGYGSILVKGTGGGISPIHNVVDPGDFQRSLLREIERTLGQSGG